MALASATLALSQARHEPALTAQEKQLNIESFELVWSTVRDQYWDPQFGGLNWQAVHDELHPEIERAATQSRARAVMAEMLERLGKSHFAIIPADLFGDLESGASGPGVTGLDVRVLDGHAIVTAVEAPAGDVHAGWEILAIDGVALAPSLAKVAALYGNSTTRELYLARSVLMKLAGPVGSRVHVEFLNGRNQRDTKELERVTPPGQPAHFGYLPTTYVRFRSRRIRDDIGYLAFNYFLDPARLMPMFGDFVQSCAKCNGLIIDLRGNPGGLGIMAMGMAGWFFDKPDLRLGTMHTRQAPLNFVVNPRFPTYQGRVAILIDGATGSTSEVFAGGMKDLGRARIFGTRSAGAALPSAIDRLPNGDAFQHALADYISEGGKSLEGIGVIPDVEVHLTRESLLGGRDPVLNAAIEWINVQK